ncbi:MAG TPA: nucleotidyltransferase domain-containing protein [Planctomycetota bacterium]|nr:nucleotidyltransferase domain-containing protein [Planctomycetota bacterium]
MTGGAGAQAVIRRLVARIVEAYRPEKVVLFGSYANGVPTEDSDVDLLIVKDTDRPPGERWSEVKRLLRGIAPTVPVSPLVYTPAELDERLKLRDYFIEDVLRTGEVVYG